MPHGLKVIFHGIVYEIERLDVSDFGCELNLEFLLTERTSYAQFIILEQPIWDRAIHFKPR